jgi:hypothetical protein
MGIKSHIPKKITIWKPTDIRYKDLSSMRVKMPEEMSRTEY